MKQRDLVAAVTGFVLALGMAAAAVAQFPPAPVVDEAPPAPVIDPSEDLAPSPPVVDPATDKEKPPAPVVDPRDGTVPPGPEVDPASEPLKQLRPSSDARRVEDQEQNRPRLVAQLGTSDSIKTIEFSSDARWLLTLGYDNSAVLWDRETGKAIRTFQEPTAVELFSGVNMARFSPDGRYVLTLYDYSGLFGGSKYTVRLWQSDTGGEVWVWPGDQLKTTTVAFSPDSSLVATGDTDGLIRLWDIATGREIRRLLGHNDVIGSIQFSPDGKWAVSGSADKTVRIWDIASGEQVRELSTAKPRTGLFNFNFIFGASIGVRTTSFSRDSRWLVTVSDEEQTARVWDTATGERVGQFGGKEHRVQQARWSRHGDWLLTENEREIFVWDRASGKRHHRFDRPGPVGTVEFSADERLLVSTHSDKYARIWDVQTGQLLRRLVGHTDVVRAATFSADGKSLVTASDDGSVRIWETTTGRETRKLEEPRLPVKSVAISADNRWVVTGMNRTARIWSMATGEAVHSLAASEGDVVCVAISPDARRVATGGDSGELRVWSVDDGKQLLRLDFERDPELDSAMPTPPVSVQAVEFVDQGRQMVTLDSNGTLSTWDVASGEMKNSFGTHGGGGPHQGSGRFAISAEKNLVLICGAPTSIYDLASGELLRQSDRPMGNSVAISAHGRWYAEGDEQGRIELFDADSGKSVHQFEERSERVVQRVEFFGPGSLATIGLDGQLRIADTLDGSRQQTLKVADENKSIADVAFSTDGRFVAIGTLSDSIPEVTGGGDILLYGLDTGRLVRRFQTSEATTATAVAFHADRMLPVTAHGELTYTWGKTNADTATKAKPAANQWLPMQVAPHARHMVAFDSSSRQIALWDTSQRRSLATLFDGLTLSDAWELMLMGPGGFCAFSPDSRRFLSIADDEMSAQLWDTSSGKQLTSLRLADAAMRQVDFVGGNDAAVTVDDNGAAVLWDLPEGRVRRTFQLPDANVVGIAVSPDGRFLATAASDDFYSTTTTAPETPQFPYDIQLWDIEAAKMLRQFQFPEAMRGSYEIPMSIQLSSDGQRLLTVPAYLTGSTARLWDTATGKPIREFQLPFAGTTAATLSPDGRFILGAGMDGVTRLWNVESGDQLCRMIRFDDGSWAVVDPQGRFDASEGADVEGLYWVVGNEPIALGQLKDRYYEPGLLDKILGLNHEPLRNVDALADPKLYPHVALTAPTADPSRLRIRLTNRGGGVGRVVVKINGKERTADARGTIADPSAEQMVLNIDLTGDPRLLPGQPNTIEVFAYNAEGYLRSRGVKRLYTPEGDARLKPPKLWGVLTGIADYRGDEIDLRYAADDAAAFATALRVAGGRLFGADHVDIQSLSTAGTDPADLPTRANVVMALDRLAREAQPEDVVVLYLAGHGVNYGGQDGDFYFLTSDAATARLADPSVRVTTALSSNELTGLLNRIPAKKQVMILDTCAAGRFIEQLTETRNVPSSQIRAIERLKDRTGVYVLAGCSADRVSYEASRYGQGLLTYSILLGMRGAALRADQYVDVATLFGFATDKVPELARDIGGIQRPMLAVPRGGASFDIGQVRSEDKPNIPLQPSRPIVVRASFQDDVRVRDHLGLTRQVNERLRESMARGRERALLFIDADEFPGAHVLVGRYRVQDQSVIVNALLLMGDRGVS